MKRPKKLRLNRETVRNLTQADLEGIAGGATQRCTTTDYCTLGLCSDACNTSFDTNC